MVETKVCKGNKGKTVQLLHAELELLGYELPIEELREPCTFGEYTHKAMIDFQASQGIVKSECTDEITANTINKVITEKNPDLFIISGLVLQDDDGSPCKNTEVNASFVKKDTKIEKKIEENGLTNEIGRYKISYYGSKFKDFLGNTWLTVTVKSRNKSNNYTFNKLGNYIANIDVPKPNQPESKQYTVTGRILTQGDMDLSGIKVHAFYLDQNLCKELKIGETSYNGSGQYQLMYTLDQHINPSNKSANLVIRVIDKYNDIIAESEVQLNAPQPAIIDLHIPPKDQFYFRGRVKESNGRFMPDLKAVAVFSFKNLGYSRVIGDNATTDKCGRYLIGYKASDFKDAEKASTFEVKIVVIDFTTKISADSSIIDLNSPASKEINDIIFPPLQPQPKYHTVEGYIQDPGGFDVSGFIVRAFDVDMDQCKEKQLGDDWIMPLRERKYEIKYKVDPLLIPNKRSPNLVVRVFNKVHDIIAESQICPNAPENAKVDLTTLSTNQFYIKGKIKDQNGNPLPGLNVSAIFDFTDLGYSKVIGEAITDKCGKYTISNHATYNSEQENMDKIDLRIRAFNPTSSVLLAESNRIRVGKPTTKVIEDLVCMITPKEGSKDSNMKQWMVEKGFKTYEDMRIWCSEHYLQFWDEMAKSYANWILPYDKIVSVESGSTALTGVESKKYDTHYSWFKGGRINVASNAIDRHARDGNKNKIAYIFIPGSSSEVTRRVSYEDLYRDVNRLANGLKSLGVQKGDLILIYMPNIPEFITSIFACAKIGAVQCVMDPENNSLYPFREHHLNSVKMIITTDWWWPDRGMKHDVKLYIDMIAIKMKNLKNIVVVRRFNEDIEMEKDRDIWWHDLLANQSDECIAESIESDSTLFTVPLSGPSEPHWRDFYYGGFGITAAQTIDWIFNLKDDDIWWYDNWDGPFSIDGLSYIVYGPLYLGITTVLSEQNNSIMRREDMPKVIQDIGVSIFCTDIGGVDDLEKLGSDVLKKYNFSSLELLGLTISKEDFESLSLSENDLIQKWKNYSSLLGKNKLRIMDIKLSKELGTFITSPLLISNPKTGLSTDQLPGLKADVLDENNHLALPGLPGRLVLTGPWPSMPSDLTLPFDTGFKTIAQVAAIISPPSSPVKKYCGSVLDSGDEPLSGYRVKAFVRSEGGSPQQIGKEALVGEDGRYEILYEGDLVPGKDDLSLVIQFIRPDGGTQPLYTVEYNSSEPMLFADDIDVKLARKLA